MDVDCRKDSWGQAVRLEQTTKFEQRRGIRRYLAIEVNADEGTNGLTIVEAIFNAFVRQPEALLRHLLHSIRARPIGGRPRPSPLG